MHLQRMQCHSVSSRDSGLGHRRLLMLCSFAHFPMKWRNKELRNEVILGVGKHDTPLGNFL